MCSKNKGADQLCGYREADLHLCLPICKNRFSHDAAQLLSYVFNKTGLMAKSAKSANPDQIQSLYELRPKKTWIFAYVKTKAQIIYAVTVQLISPFVFTT